MIKYLKYLLLTIVVSSCGNETNNKNAENSFSDDDIKLQKRATAFFQNLPEPLSFEGPKVELGKKLYYETALSFNNEMSCNSCHMLDKFGVDNLKTSPGAAEGTLGNRNSPSVYNAYFHIAQFWDGRAENLSEQAKGPILNPIEMGIKDEQMAIDNIKNIEIYHTLFAEAFPESKEPITYQNIADAIAEFEKTLATPSRFDEYLKGDLAAITDLEKDGLKAFVNNGCITCHMGPGLGGNMYQKFGLVKGPYWEYTGGSDSDFGRFNVTKKESDKYFFKVPSLRNIEKTAPYFHDGSVETLEQAIDIMAKTQTGRDLDPKDIESIAAFLKSLTGEIPKHVLLANN